MADEIKKKEPTVTAFHAKSGTTHIVGIGNLRVMITNDEASWFAQSLEIDYAAAGTSREDVKARFERGLERTITEHLRVYGNIEKVLKQAPQEIWNELLNPHQEVARYFQVTQHEIAQFKVMSGVLPFEGITYFEKSALQETAAMA